MPDKKFLEEASLYREYSFRFPGSALAHIPKVAINMFCENCGSNQTFTMQNNYGKLNETPTAGIGRRIAELEYICMHCRVEFRYFSVLMDHINGTLQKVGQHPPWDISGNKDIERRLGEHRGFYRRGLICESQSYGIGAFSYYRRIVEDIIDSLLNDISGMLSGTELEKYQEALEKTKATRVTHEKIALVKDLLPNSLRPEGQNPLDVLHSALSEGLHERSEEECLEDAEHLRTVLAFLVGQVAAHKGTAKEFSASMKLLLRNARKE